MLTTTYVNLRYWFYPIGNTPAVNLLRDTSIDELDKVAILSIACGDPRNILYTLWCEGNHDTNFEFTACDLDAAVLARNVLLFTMVMDGSAKTPGSALTKGYVGALWNIFYHLFIPDEHLVMLQDHAANLLAVSTSLNTWRGSAYGGAIDYLSEHSLVQIRKIWMQYAATKTISQAEHNKFDQRFRQAITKLIHERIGQGLSLHGLRSAGAAFLSALPILPKAFKRYWETGVAGGNQNDRSALGRSDQGRVNPTFAISTSPADTFAVHYGSDPLLGFHLAEAFGKKAPVEQALEGVVKAAKDQFHNWCNTYAKLVKAGLVKINLHCGDAIAMSHTLQGHTSEDLTHTANVVSLRVSPWKATPLVLDVEKTDTLRKGFDVIDTSNLTDHVGILSVLPAVVPLLRRKASSVLYTETLLQADELPSKSLTIMLCSDVATASIILGVAPVGCLLGVSTDFVPADAINLEAFDNTSRSSRQSVGGEMKQYHMRIPWKITESYRASTELSPSRYSIAFEADQIASYLFDVYLKMFCRERMPNLGSMQRQLLSPLSGDLRYYARLNFVVFIRLAKPHAQTDWEKCMLILVDKVWQDQTLLVGRNSFQELLLWLQLYGLGQSPDGLMSPLEARFATASLANQLPALKIFSSEPLTTGAIHLALVVPRSKLSAFTSEAPDRIGTPGLHISILDRSAVTENSFFAIQCFFGTLKAHETEKFVCSIEEDESGWTGSSDLIVTCAIPLGSVAVRDAGALRIRLCVNSSPSTIEFTRKLGLENIVHSSGLEDEEHVWLLRRPPGIISRTTTSSVLAPAPPRPASFRITKSCKMGGDAAVKCLTVRADFDETSSIAKKLRSGATMTLSQDSPCQINVLIGTHEQELVYPFAVDSTRASIRIARKSLYVDVSCPVVLPDSNSKYQRASFPIFSTKGQPTIWGLSRVNVTQQPRIDDRGDMSWLHAHMGLGLSAAERDSNRLMNSSDRQPNRLLELKESLHIIFQSFAGQNPSSQGMHLRHFQLHVDKDCDTIILANTMHHDRNNGSIFIDAYVINLAHSRLASMESAMMSCARHTSLSLNISTQEHAVWKQLMPYLVERCRYSWKHKTDCEYRRENRVPLSTEHGVSPICTCAEGKDLAGFPTDKNLQGIKRFATRIALCPISAVPYLESMISDRDRKDTVSEATSTSVRQNGRLGTSSSASVAARQCGHCGKRGKTLLVCAGCGVMHYCDRACQKADWKGHKKMCKETE